jgi:hypothetical protein
VHKHAFYPITENPILNNVSIHWIPFSCITSKQYIAHGILNSTAQTTDEKGKKIWRGNVKGTPRLDDLAGD